MSIDSRFGYAQDGLFVVFNLPDAARHLVRNVALQERLAVLRARHWQLFFVAEFGADTSAGIALPEKIVITTKLFFHNVYRLNHHLPEVK